MIQIHCLNIKQVCFLNLFRKFVDEYYSKKKIHETCFFDSQMMQELIRKRKNYFDLFKNRINMKDTIRQKDCQ